MKVTSLTNYCVMACSHRRREEDKTVLSCPCRRCKQANSYKLEAGSRWDKIHRNWVESHRNWVENCLVGGVNNPLNTTKLKYGGRLWLFFLHRLCI